MKPLPLLLVLLGLALPVLALARPAPPQEAAAAPADQEAEKKIRNVLAELDLDRRGNMNVPVEDGRLLYVLARASGAKAVVEIGTSNGYSGLWLALAMRETGGHLTTFEIDPERAAAAERNFARAGVADLVTIVRGDAHEKVSELSEPLDLVFLDADKPGYVDYLQKLRPRVRSGGLILAHNMKSPPPDPRYVEAITTDPAFETLFLHMEGAGMGVTLKRR
ncbi:MAG: O-methyltransferase [Planctomycetota bacterium]